MQRWIIIIDFCLVSFVVIVDDVFPLAVAIMQTDFVCCVHRVFVVVEEFGYWEEEAAARPVAMRT